jgi:hypothetical protein
LPIFELSAFYRRLLLSLLFSVPRRPASGSQVSDNALDGSYSTLNVGIACLPVDDGRAHASHAPPSRTAEICFTRGIYPSDCLVGSAIMIGFGRTYAGIEEAYQALIDRRLPDETRSRQFTNARDKRMSMRAATLDQLGNSRPAELAQGGIGRNPSTAPRPLGVPVRLVPRTRLFRHVASQVGERCAMRLFIRNEGIPAVEGRIEPFVAVRRPGIGKLGAAQVMPMLRARGYPQAESAIDMHPGSVPMSEWDELAEEIEGADVKIAGLQQHDGGASAIGFESARKNRGFELPLVVAR